jgi:MFS family permease
MVRLIKVFGSGLPLLAFQWVATDLPHPALALAMQKVAISVGELAIMLYGGWLADYKSTRSMVVVGDIGAGIALVGAGALAMLHMHYAVYALFVTLAVVYVMAGSVSRAPGRTLIPRVVDRQDLPKVNAWFGSLRWWRGILGSLAAGYLIALVGPVGPLFLAAAFIVASGLVAMKTLGTSPAEQSRPRPPIRPTIHSVLDSRVLSRVLIFAFAMQFASGMAMVELTVYARFDLGFSALKLGIALAVGSLGSVLGLVMSPRLLPNRLRAAVLLPPIALATTLGLWLVTPTPVGFVAGLVTLMLSTTMLNAATGYLRQTHSPITRTGSIAGTLGTVHQLGNLAGVLVGGALDTILALTTSMRVALVVLVPVVALAWWLWRSTNGGGPISRHVVGEV